MLTSVARTATLARHPESRGAAVRTITVRVRRAPAGALALTYVIESDLARLVVPPPQMPQFRQGLWRHTCCECFIRIAGEPGYHEFNFSPSGVWAAYGFARYREGAPREDAALTPDIAVRVRPDRLELDAVIPLDRLPARTRGGLALALSAVIEENDGALSYWALRHAPGKPDFHHPDAFAMELE